MADRKTQARGKPPSESSVQLVPARTPPLLSSSDDEKRRFRDAEARRARRLETCRVD